MIPTTQTTDDTNNNNNNNNNNNRCYQQQQQQQMLPTTTTDLESTVTPVSRFTTHSPLFINTLINTDNWASPVRHLDDDALTGI